MSLRDRYEDIPSEELNRRVAMEDEWSSTLRAPPPRHDPILTPIFTAMWGTAGISFGMFSISYAAVASAIAAGGDYWEPLT